MSPTRRLLIGATVLVTVATGYAIGRVLFRPANIVVQPIDFNHKLHATELEIDCVECHQYVRTGRHAGLPDLETCLGCHEEPLTENPEELKLIELASSDQPASFKKLFRLADHTLYAHSRHVEAAGLECEVCHGALATTTQPPVRPLVRITMDMCVDCHEKSNVSSDCTVCHR